MKELVGNFLRGSVSTVMYVVLLFTLTRSRFNRRATIVFATLVFTLNMTTTLWFYLYGNLTALSRFTVLMFLVTALAIKPLTRLNFMQWCFTFLTTINIAMMIIILSFHLGKLFAEPQAANTIIRFLLYLGVILLFRRVLLPSYYSVVDNWPIFSGLMVAIFLNLSYYFFVTEDIQETLMTNRWPLLLLVVLSLAAYGTVFHALRRFTALSVLEREHTKVKQETGLLHETALRLEQYANHDTLTGLSNRRSFFERLDEIIALSEQDAHPFSLLYIDLDRFKEVNDAHGHEVGDQLLHVIGSRLAQNVRQSDIVARLGGDEFAIITREEVQHAQVEHLARRILASLQEPIDIGKATFTIDASIGIAFYPEAGKDGRTLLRNADSAMYEVKHTQTGGVGIFSVRTAESADVPSQA